MTRLRYINPNSTRSMTDKVLAAAQAVRPPTLHIDAATSSSGPPAIQGAADGEAALPGLLEEAQRAVAQGSDIIAIACFDDTGMAAVRQAVRVPVIGIGQSAFLQAMALGRRFSVVTTLAVSVPVIEANLAYCGVAAACARVRASGVAVLELERAGGDAEARVAAALASAARQDDVGAVVLGCAGMSDLSERLQRDAGLPVIDGVAAAVGVAALIAQRTNRT